MLILTLGVTDGLSEIDGVTVGVTETLAPGLLLGVTLTLILGVTVGVILTDGVILGVALTLAAGLLLGVTLIDGVTDGLTLIEGVTVGVGVGLTAAQRVNEVISPEELVITR